MERTTDLLVAGGGMAGLAAGARAVELGLDVVVAEKTDRPGGSAALSAGIVWTAPDVETARRVAPDGDPELARLLVEGFEPGVEAIRAAGVAVSERWYGQMGYGVAHRVDIAALLAHWASVVADGGDLRRRTAVRRLLVDDDGAVGGAVLSGDEGRSVVRARATLLATGGFQGDPGTVKALLGFDADRMLVRSRPGSVGDGLRLGRAAGAGTSRGLGGFYGHLVPHPLDAFPEDRFLPLTQYHSNRSILVNLRGRRYTDESLGDEVSNIATVRQPGGRAVLLCDERVRREHVVGAPYPHGQVVDRFAAGRELGAQMASADTIDALADAVQAWGVDGVALRRTLAAYAAAARGETVALDAPLPAEPHPLVEPPFHAVHVQPTLTFPYGGLPADGSGRVLDPDGHPVCGLYVAGADAGGLQGPGYLGGLVLGLVFGRRTAEAVAAALAGTPSAVATADA
jgi:succinate dehydrogenase/fumarate reductase flavoprotein subunit